MSGSTTKRAYDSKEAAVRDDLLNSPTPTSMVLFAKKFPYYLMTEDMILFMKTKDPMVCRVIVDHLKSLPKEQKEDHMKSKQLQDAIVEYVASLTSSPKAVRDAIEVLRVETNGNIGK
ncbi:MAG TPA: hypothetical protein VND15_00450 [Candidatus Acidoferrales bacterium]|nr:hypothetical protein [Candidatus Acidoferrales bacterium]